MDHGSSVAEHAPAGLSASEIGGLQRETGAAVGLPGRVYYDEAFYRTERRTVFAAGWTGVGFGSDIPAPGDVMPVSVAGHELILVRDRDGQVRVYHNICRHRGMKLVKAPGNVRSIRCSYHCWTYGLDGRLVATPAIGGIDANRADDFDFAGLGLLEVRAGHYLDIVFVNLDGAAPDLDGHLRPVRERIERTFDTSLLRAADAASGRGEREFPVNWKILVEGGIEDYHLPFVHRTLTHSRNYLVEDGGDVYAGFSATRDLAEARKRYETKASDGGELPFFPAMLDSGTAETLVVFLFPSTVVTCTPNCLIAAVQLPLGPERTRFVSRTYFIGDAATAPGYRKLRDENLIYWKEVLDEDDGPWREVQAMAHVREELGMAVRFSPHWERALHLFQKYLARRVGAGATDQSGARHAAS